ncbi:MAG TPA: hypothetical protein VIT92_01745 [Burkholderiaceae bacterium]
MSKHKGNDRDNRSERTDSGEKKFQREDGQYDPSGGGRDDVSRTLRQDLDRGSRQSGDQGNQQSQEEASRQRDPGRQSDLQHA